MRASIVCTVAAALLIAPALAQAPAAPSVHAAMKGVIAPGAQTIWDTSNLAMDDDGNADAKRLSPAQWSAIGAAGQKIRDMSLALAMAQPIRVSGAGETIQGEGDPNSTSAAQVQGFVDADPAGFADQARRMAAAAGEFVAAAKSRDAVKLGTISGDLDQVCEECHMRYWYPQQNAGQPAPAAG